MPRPRFEKKSMKSSVRARSRTCGPTTIPSSSSTTTTGGARRLGRTATDTAASAATATIVKNDSASTSITGGDPTSVHVADALPGQGYLKLMTLGYRRIETTALDAYSYDGRGPC